MGIIFQEVSMSLQTNLRGRLRNTTLPRNQGLMPVFEAVVNSIHSIEEKGNIHNGRIILTIIREPQSEIDIGNGSAPTVLGFRIEDNGCGLMILTLILFKRWILTIR